MGKTLSTYLDLLRFLSAVAVFLHHLAPHSGRYEIFQRYGDDAVMVFFVLSGFVIAHVTAEKESDAITYSASRIARLYSVAVPVLLLTLIFDFVGRSFGGPYVEGHDSNGWLRMAISLTFTNQLWGIDIKPWSNSPYWSISYEFWYYVFFAIATFAKRKTLLITAWAAIVGPCILLLLPVWYIGVWVYRWRPQISAPIGWTLFLSSVALYVAYNAVGGRDALLSISDVSAIAPFGLHKARFWLHDYAIGLMVAAHFIGARAVCQTFSFGNLAAPIRAVAVYTFALYMIHYPLQLLVISARPIRHWTDDLYVWGATAVTAFALGWITERWKTQLRYQLLQLRHVVMFKRNAHG